MIHTALSFVIPLKRVSKTLVYWTGSSLSSSCPSGLSLTYLLPFKTFTDIAFASHLILHSMSLEYSRSIRSLSSRSRLPLISLYSIPNAAIEVLQSTIEWILGSLGPSLRER